MKGILATKDLVSLTCAYSQETTKISCTNEIHSCFWTTSYEVGCGVNFFGPRVSSALRFTLHLYETLRGSELTALNCNHLKAN